MKESYLLQTEKINNIKGIDEELKIENTKMQLKFDKMSSQINELELEIK